MSVHRIQTAMAFEFADLQQHDWWLKKAGDVFLRLGRLSASMPLANLISQQLPVAALAATGLFYFGLESEKVKTRKN
jgi:hypothetical protein